MRAGCCICASQAREHNPRSHHPPENLAVPSKCLWLPAAPCMCPGVLTTPVSPPVHSCASEGTTGVPRDAHTQWGQSWLRCGFKFGEQCRECPVVSVLSPSGMTHTCWSSSQGEGKAPQALKEPLGFTKAGAEPKDTWPGKKLGAGGKGPRLTRKEWQRSTR